MDSMSGAKPAGLGVVITSSIPEIAVAASYRPPFRPTRGSSEPERGLTKTEEGGGATCVPGAAGGWFAAVWPTQSAGNTADNVRAAVAALRKNFEVVRFISGFISSPSTCAA